MSPDSDWQKTSNDKMKWAEAARDYMMRLGHADPGKRGAVLEEGRRLALAMKSAGAMEDLAWLTDRLRSYLEHDAEIRCLQAQALVDLGMPLAAKDVLTAILRVTSPGSDCWLEAQGLKGRIYKQIFLNARNRADQHAVAALKAAITAYRTAFESAPERSPWQGVNLAALVLKSRLMGRRIRTGVDPADVAQQVCTVLDQKADSERDQWWHATYAEAELARGRVDAFATHLKLFLSNPQTDAFALGSFLRQLVEVWDLEAGNAAPEDRALVGMLRGRLLQMRNGAISIDARDVSRQGVTEASRNSLEKTFGPAAIMQLDWWQLGVDRARSVGAIYGPNRAGRPARQGTGFLVQVRPTGGQEGPKRCLLTNAHVLGDPAVAAIRSKDEAFVRFEGRDAGCNHRIKEIIWTSSHDRHDATLLDIEDPPEDSVPLRSQLPSPQPDTRLYIIGHAHGDELAFSFQDNELLDHEGPPGGTPRQLGVLLLHYRTPTEPGSSGSPVFVEDRWTAIALHHSGTKAMSRLNGKDGTYPANEGIALSCISDALKTEKGLELVFA